MPKKKVRHTFTAQEQHTQEQNALEEKETKCPRTKCPTGRAPELRHGPGQRATAGTERWRGRKRTRDKYAQGTACDFRCGDFRRADRVGDRRGAGSGTPCAP